MSDDGKFEEWLTIAACAKRLALHERQVRRYAQRLKDTDRTPAGQTPMRVRVSAILAERDRTVSADVRLEAEENGQDTPPDTPDSVRSESALTVQQIASIYEAQLQAKDAVIEAKNDLIEAKDAVILEKDSVLRVLSELSEERKQQIARMDAELSELREQVKRLAAPSVTEETVQDTVQDAQEARTATEASETGISTPLAEQAQNRPKTGTEAASPHKWWQVWRKLGR